MAEIFSAEFWAQYGGLLVEGTIDTLVMVVVSTFFAYLLGLPMGVALILTQPYGIRPNRVLNRVLGWIINIGRSLPFIILMVAIMDFTKLIVGTKIGVKGAIVPLVISAAPFIARMVETSLAFDCGVMVNILGADTSNIDGKAFGTMLLGLPDDPNEAAKALSYIRSQPNVTAEEVEYHG